MATQGPNNPATTVDDATVGTVAWVNPNNAQVSDGIYTTSGSLAGSTANFYSHYLKVTNFGFSIPSTATINGIFIEVQKFKWSFPQGGGVLDTVVSIIKSNGSIGSTNKADATGWTTTSTYFPYGSSSDLWGEIWTYSDINNSNFGLAFQGFGGLGASNGAALVIDNIRITVYYTTPISTLTGISSMTGVQSITL